MKRISQNVKDPVSGIWQSKITEEHVIADIVQCLSLNGASVHRIVERIPWGKRTSTPGMPDLAGWFTVPTLEHPGLVFPLHFWIEAKKPGGKHRPAQIAWIEAAQRDHVIAFFADSREQMVSEFKSRGIVLRIS